MCLCTGMLYDPQADAEEKTYDNAVMSRLNKIKQSLFLKEKSMKKLVLAYSGGLDTSYCVNTSASWVMRFTR